MYGWPTVGFDQQARGDTPLREVLRLLRSGQSFAFTVDGRRATPPRTSGRDLSGSNAPGPTAAARIAGSNFWQLPTWDRYFIPKPFSRVHVHIGEPLQLPTDIPRDEQEQWQQQIETMINTASDEAQRRWKSNAVSTGAKTNSNYVIFTRPAAVGCRTTHSATSCGRWMPVFQCACGTVPSFPWAGR
jgi:hypothetical protein